MRNSSLLKWAQAQTKGGGPHAAPAAAAAPNGPAASSNGAGGKDGNRSWIHPPDALQRGHIAYLVKFLGTTEVGAAKGILVVKEAIRKLQFSAQLRKAEGSKTPKVELTVSIDGVAIQEPKSKRILHQYPLHRISYCADDKGDKRFFSFIAKQADADGPDAHACFVFVSDKLAEEITLTIGQAFDLAYRRFVESAGRDLQAQRRLMLLQQRALRLDAEARALRQRLRAVAALAPQTEVEQYMQREGIRDLFEVDLPPSAAAAALSSSSTGSEPTTSPNSSATSTVSYDLLGASTPNSSIALSSDGSNLLALNPSSASSTVSPVSTNSSGANSSTHGGTNGLQSPPPPVPPRAFEVDNRSFGLNPPCVGTRLEGLLLDELETDDDFDPRAFESSGPVTNGTSNNIGNSLDHHDEQHGKIAAPRLAPPPKGGRDSRRAANGAENPFQEDLFGATPFAPPAPAPRASASAAPAPNAAAPNASAAAADPFGMGDFGAGRESSQFLENAIGLLDRRILEMKDGFSRGLSFGNDDFSLESLDPLRN